MTAEASFSPGRHAWRATGRSDLDVRVRRARRHSRMVRLLRFGIPGSLVAAAGLYWMSGWLNPFGAIPGLDMDKIVISRSQVAMDRPRVAGFTRDGRSYELTATTATQDLRRPQFIALKGIRGKVEMPDGDVVSITADEGIYDTKGETVVLRKNVMVVTSDGTEVRMQEAQVDARNGRVVSERAVEVVSQAGRLSAKQMELQEGGNVMTFRGGVTMDVQQPERTQQGASQ